MKLNLKNPIVFFDLETTGTNINTDRIVEICYLKVYPNGNEETKTMRINPEMHIPEQSSAIHGIYDKDVADCPTFKGVAKDIARILGANSSRDGYMEGNGYQVTWTFGHLCELKEPNDYSENWKHWSLAALPMIPLRFGIKLIPDDGIKK